MTTIEEEMRIRLESLQRAVRNYLDRPGCNIPSRQVAMGRLQWAVEQSETEVCFNCKAKTQSVDTFTINQRRLCRTCYGHVIA